MTSQSKNDPPNESSSFGFVREVASLLLVVGGLGALAYAFIRDQLLMRHAETHLIVDVKTTTGTQTDLCGPPTKDGRPVVISMLYSDDKQAWIEHVADRFAKLCPNVQVKLSAMGDIESANAILAGEQKPMLWSPADELVLRYLDVRWRKEKGSEKALFKLDQQTSIVQSPLAVLIWDDRLQVVNRVMSARDTGRGPWTELMCATIPPDPTIEGMVIEDMVPGTWIDLYNPVIPPPPEKKPAWLQPKKPPPPPPPVSYRAPFPTLEQMRGFGRVKFGHTSPTRSATGLEALYLMAYDYVLPPLERALPMDQIMAAAPGDGHQEGVIVSTDVIKGDFQRAFRERKKQLEKWLKRCEAGLEPAPRSATLLTDTMFNVGASRYDAVITYEHLTFRVFEKIDAFSNAMADMRIIYPRPTVMNKHPVVSLELSEAITDEQKLASVKWIDYLRSDEMQKKAIEHGFRPADSKVAIRTYESESNPFLRFRRYGVTFDTPTVEPPRLDGDDVYQLVRIWEDATGRN